MSAAPRQRRSYDPQIRRLVAEGRGDDIVRRERIPRSTVSGWRNRPLPTLVSVGPADGSEANLRAEIAKLERRVKVLTAVMIVLLTLVRVSKARLNNARLADADDKEQLVRAARRAQPALSKHVILLLIGVSVADHPETQKSDH